MSITVSAVWNKMSTEDYENQPYLYNGGPAWGDWVTAIWMDKWMPKKFYWRGLFPLLTCCAPESPEKDIKWVKPRKLIRAAERLKKRLNSNSAFINDMLQIYSKHSLGAESPEMKKKIIILCISLIHFLVSILIMAVGIAESLNRQTINYVQTEPDIAVKVLPPVILFPLWLFKSSFRDDSSLLFLLAFNSVLWGIFLYWLG